MYRDKQLLLDGYNVLTTIEAALSGGVVLACRDGCYRDMASIHGTYRKVEETPPALMLIGKIAAELGVASCLWYLDSPVSNSGRLKGADPGTGRAETDGNGRSRWSTIPTPCCRKAAGSWRRRTASCLIDAGDG